MDLPSQMVLFAKVVDGGSFSAAARSLDLSPSSISRQIAQLEDTLGLRLLNRTNHGISTTDEGWQFLKRCQVVASEVFEAKALLDSLSGRPTGRLRLASTVAFGNVQLLPVLPRFLSENREVSLSLHLTDETVDFGSDDVDVAIRFSEQLDDQNLIVRKLARNRRVLVASPGYVQKHGLPQAQADLAGHTCLTLTTAPDWNSWVPPGTETARQVFQASSADAVYHAALAGIGIARLSTYLVNADIEAGRLVRVLPDYRQEESAIVAAYRDRRNVSPRIRAFIDFLGGCFGPVPPWERI